MKTVPEHFKHIQEVLQPRTWQNKLRETLYFAFIIAIAVASLIIAGFDIANGTSVGFICGIIGYIIFGFSMSLLVKSIKEEYSVYKLNKRMKQQYGQDWEDWLNGTGQYAKNKQ